MTDPEAQAQVLVYVATGGNTCEECWGFDGEMYVEGRDDLPTLPRHPNCNCFLVPI